jgi:hypothetical protein
MKTASLGELTTVPNDSRKFGADTHYVVGRVSIDGVTSPICLTQEQVEIVKARAASNPEDIPRVDEGESFRDGLVIGLAVGVMFMCACVCCALR